MSNPVNLPEGVVYLKNISKWAVTIDEDGCVTNQNIQTSCLMRIADCVEESAQILTQNYDKTIRENAILKERAATLWDQREEFKAENRLLKQRISALKATITKIRKQADTTTPAPDDAPTST